MEEDLIGLSMSECIKDIVEGKVKRERVRAIITGTKVQFPEQFSRICSIYNATKWRGIEKEAMDLLFEFFLLDKIIQPRLLGLPPLDIAGGHWAKVCDEVA